MREEILAGDLRPLYLAWLSGVPEALDGGFEVTSPSVPDGLNSLSSAQTALAEFLRVDGDVLDAAAKRSAAATDRGSKDRLRSWIESLPESEKNELLCAVLEHGASQAAATLRRRFTATTRTQREPSIAKAAELMSEADAIRERREAEQRERAARERARRDAERAAQRAEHLAAMRRRGETPWEEVEQLVASKSAKAYDEAIALLGDLREIASDQRALERFATRVRSLRERHSAKSSFVRRLAAAKLDSKTG